MRNSLRGRQKTSQLEKDTGRFVLYTFFILVLMCIFCALVYATWVFNNPGLEQKYIDPDEYNYAQNFGIKFGNWLLNFGSFLPISLLLTLESTKIVQSLIIGIDQGLAARDGTPCTVNTSALNEELGQIDYVFSDKTGTLTMNEMRFKYLIVDNHVYGERTGYAGPMPDECLNVDFSDPGAWEALLAKGSTPESQKLLDAIKTLSLCHTIMIDEDGDYSASSPDEMAFVGFAKLMGSEFMGTDDDNNMTVNEFGTIRAYKILDTFEFNSDRKRMSIIVRDEAGKIFMYAKGADSIMMPRMDRRSENELVHVEEKLDKYASIGLRTLLFGHKEMSETEYMEFKMEYEVDNTKIGCKSRLGQQR